MDRWCPGAPASCPSVPDFPAPVIWPQGPAGPGRAWEVLSQLRLELWSFNMTQGFQVWSQDPPPKAAILLQLAQPPPSQQLLTLPRGVFKAQATAKVGAFVSKHIGPCYSLPCGVKTLLSFWKGLGSLDVRMPRIGSVLAGGSFAEAGQ